MAEALLNRLREAREAKGWTQAELAARVGVSRKTVNTVENRVFTPSATLAIKLAEALGLSVSNCSGSSADLADLPDQIALRDREIGEMHAPAGQKHAQNPDFAADAVGALVIGIGVGADRQIAALAIVDALRRDQTFGAQVGCRRQPLGRPLNRTAGDGV